MSGFSWRTLLGVCVIVIVIVIGVNLAFFAMWGRGTPSAPYGPGPMMGPWMWGGMGLFWIFAIVGFLFMLIVLGLVVNVLFGSTARPQPPSTGSPAHAQRIQEVCKSCGRALETDWVACPYCGAARSQSREPHE